MKEHKCKGMSTNRLEVGYKQAAEPLGEAGKETEGGWK